MRLPFSPQTVGALVQVISDGRGNSMELSIGIYRCGPRLDALMRACSARMAVGSGPGCQRSPPRLRTEWIAATSHAELGDRGSASPAELIDYDRLAAELDHLTSVSPLMASLRGSATIVAFVDPKLTRRSSPNQSAP